MGKDSKGRFLPGHKYGQPPGEPSRSPGRRNLFTTLLKERIAKEEGDDTRIGNVVEALLMAAESGNIQAIREIADRLEGKPKQSFEHSGPDGDPIPHNYDATDAMIQAIEKLRASATARKE